MDMETCETSILPGFVLSISALLMEQFLGNSNHFKANSISESIMQTFKKAFSLKNTADGNGPYPTPPPALNETIKI